VRALPHSPQSVTLLQLHLWLKLREQGAHSMPLQDNFQNDCKMREEARLSCSHDLDAMTDTSRLNM
jgi:hypothetical protein